MKSFKTLLPMIIAASTISFLYFKIFKTAQPLFAPHVPNSSYEGIIYQNSGAQKDFFVVNYQNKECEIYNMRGNLYKKLPGKNCRIFPDGYVVLYQNGLRLMNTNLETIWKNGLRPKGLVSFSRREFFFITHSNDLIKINLKGEVLKKLSIPSRMRNPVMALRGDRVVVSSSNGQIAIVDKESFSITKSLKVNMNITGARFFSRNKLSVLVKSPSIKALHVDIGTLVEEDIFEFRDLPSSNTIDSSFWEQTPKGNYLITDSENNRAFEVSEQGQLVWEWYASDKGARLLSVEKISREHAIQIKP